MQGDLGLVQEDQRSGLGAEDLDDQTNHSKLTASSERLGILHAGGLQDRGRAAHVEEQVPNPSDLAVCASEYVGNRHPLLNAEKAVHLADDALTAVVRKG